MNEEPLAYITRTFKLVQLPASKRYPSVLVAMNGPGTKVCRVFSNQKNQNDVIYIDMYYGKSAM